MTKRRRLTFEESTPEPKFEILGRKVRGGAKRGRRPISAGTEKASKMESQWRTRSFDSLRLSAVDLLQRKDTLLVELEQSRRGNTFLDHRLGEADLHLTQEDRALARFQKQRLLESKDNTFELNERDDFEQLTSFADEEGNLQEGRLGRENDSGSEPDLFAQVRSGKSDMQGTVQDIQGLTGQRGKKEVMEEIIAKSKAHRAEKAKQREADYLATVAVDNELASLVNDGLLMSLTGRAVSDKTVDNTADAAFDRDRRALVDQPRTKVSEKSQTATKSRAAGIACLLAAEEPRQDGMLDGDSEPNGGMLPAGGYALRRARRKRTGAVEAGLEERMTEEDSEDGSEVKDSIRRPEKPGLEQRRRQRAAGNHPLQASFRAAAAELLAKHGLSKTAEPESSASANSSEAEDADTNPPGLVEGPSNVSQHDHLGPESSVVSAACDLSSYNSYKCLTSAVSSNQLDAALGRARMHALESPGGPREAQQIVFGYMVQDFADRAGHADLDMPALDVLTVHVLAAVPEVPLYAAKTALARLTRLQEQMSACLSNSGADLTWPSRRQLFILRLLFLIFPASDRRHPVMTPAIMLIAAFLAICPVRSCEDAEKGLFLSGLGLQMAGAATRVMPEPLTFASRTIECTMDLPSSRALASSLMWTSFGPAAFSASADEHVDRCSAALAALEIIDKAADIYSQSRCLPELLRPVQEILVQVPSSIASEEVKLAAQKLLSKLRSVIARIEGNRLPIIKSKAVKEVKLFNPRFEENFSIGRDNDPDREKAESRKLKRQLVRERRGAIRELRRDAAFIGDVAGRERTARRAEIRASLQINTAWLHKLESDFKSGGQAGMWKKAKKR